MGSRLTEFSGSGTMAGPQKRGLLIALLLAALPVIAVAAIIINGDRQESVAVESQTFAVDSADRKFFNEPVEGGISEAWTGNFAVDPADRKFLEPPAGGGTLSDQGALSASDLSGLRWRAMGRFYQKNGMLTRDSEAMIAPSGLAEALSAERYQRLGEESQTNAPPVITSGVAPVEEEFAYYTERYWKMAAEPQLVEPLAIETGADLAESVDAIDAERNWYQTAVPASSSLDEVHQYPQHSRGGKARPE